MATTASTRAATFLTLAKFCVDFRVPISFVVVCSLITLGLVTSSAQATTERRLDPQAWMSLLLIVSGIAVRSWSAGVLRKGESLTNTGPYSLCRHPLYFGSALMAVGFASFLWSPAFYVPALVLLCAVYACTIAEEEGRLARRDARLFADYCAKTPRFLPVRPRNFRRGAWSAAIWMKNHEYRALGTTAAGIVGLIVWRLWVMF